MKIALYGMPCAGKSTLMDRITDAKVINGSQELRRICGGSFSELSEEEKHQVRIKYTEYINGLNDEVIVSDGHYSFMENVAFTEADGDLYDIFIYLYCSTETLKERYALSEKNAKFAGESTESLRQWQEFEINNLREECHRRNKDFYVVSDNEEDQNKFFDFLSLIREGSTSRIPCIWLTEIKPLLLKIHIGSVVMAIQRSSMEIFTLAISRFFLKGN